jgi:hypothetical protein
MMIPLISREFLRPISYIKNPQILILVPLMLSYMIFDVFQLYYAFDYMPSRKKYFVGLYDIYRTFVLISYIFYSFAFLWAPKKEVFL